MRVLVGGIGNNRLYFRESCRHTVIHFIKGHAVMYISRGNDRLQNKPMLITGGVGLIGKLPLVLSLHKQAAVRVCYALGHRTLLFLLPPGQLLLRGVVSGLLCWSRWFVIVIKGLLSMALPVCIYLFHQFLGIVFGRNRNLDLHLLFAIGVRFDMSTVYKYRLGGKVSCLRHLLQNPTEYLLYCLFGKAMTKIIAHRGEMRRFLLQGVSQKPAVSYI